MRVLMLAQSFRPAQGGGPRWTTELAEGLAGAGHDILVLTHEIGDCRGTVHCAPRLEIRYLPLLTIRGAPIFPRRMLDQYVARFKPDVIQTSAPSLADMLMPPPLRRAVRDTLSRAAGSFDSGACRSIAQRAPPEARRLGRNSSDKRLLESVANRRRRTRGSHRGHSVHRGKNIQRTACGRAQRARPVALRRGPGCRAKLQAFRFAASSVRDARERSVASERRRRRQSCFRGKPPGVCIFSRKTPRAPRLVPLRPQEAGWLAVVRSFPPGRGPPPAPRPAVYEDPAGRPMVATASASRSANHFTLRALLRHMRRCTIERSQPSRG